MDGLLCFRNQKDKRCVERREWRDVDEYRDDDEFAAHDNDDDDDDGEDSRMRGKDR